MASGADRSLFHVQFKGSCYWAVIGGFRSLLFVAEEPSPMKRTCTAVNFDNLHSLLGLFGGLFFNGRNRVTGVCLWYKIALFLRERKHK